MFGCPMSRGFRDVGIFVKLSRQIAEVKSLPTEAHRCLDYRRELRGGKDLGWVEGFGLQHGIEPIEVVEN